MATPQLGTKYTCYQCTTKFYDMKKSPPTCPKCAANQKNAPPEPKQKHDKHAVVEEEEEEVVKKVVRDEDEPRGLDEEAADADAEEEDEDEDDY